MAEENRIEIELILDDKTIKKGFIRTEQLAGKAGKKIGAGLNSGLGASALNGGLSILRSKLLALGALLSSGILFSKSIRASIRQQDAIENLNIALTRLGSGTEDASLEMQAFAREIQKTTKVGDEATIELFSLASSFARNREEAAQMVKAAIELNAAMGIELESGIRNLGKTFSGLQGELGEALPALRNLTQEQLRSGAAVDLILKKFSGSAAGQIRTFGGALQQLSNNFSDFFEGLGDLITRSPRAQQLIRDLSSVVGNLADKLKDRAAVAFGGQLESLTAKSRSLRREQEELRMRLEEVLGAGNAFGNTFNRNLLKAQLRLKQIPDQLLAVDQQLEKLQQRSLQRDILGGGPAARPVDPAVLRATQELQKQLVSINLQRINTEKQTNALIEDERARNLEADMLLKEEQFFLETQYQLRRQELLKQFDDQGIMDANLKHQLLQSLEMEHNERMDGLERQRRRDAEKNMIALRDSISTIMKTGITNIVAGTFQRLGAALAQGSMAFEDFTGFVLGALGDILIQTGTTLVATGIGMEAIRASIVGLTGGPALFYGLALIAMGGLLKALSGGGGVAAAPALGGGGVTAGAEQDAPVTEITEPAEPETRVTVNIKGDVLDSKQTGLRLSEIIADHFDREGGVLVTA